ncbi:hypothetical protein HanRHA438_Chr05g0236681 [Helianthus annuus]|nr:hypothetical protein HanRHA438_Chr05g0236681 [Helianthus annuus]
MRKTETESSTIVWDEGGDREQQPFSRHPYRFLEPIYPESEPEDEPKFDEDGMLPDEGEYYWSQQAVNGANREEEEEENKDYKSLMVSSGDIQEENMGGVEGDGPTVVKGGSVASMISLPLVPEVKVGSFVDATFTEFQIEGELIQSPMLAEFQKERYMPIAGEMFISRDNYVRIFMHEKSTHRLYNSNKKSRCIYEKIRGVHLETQQGPLNASNIIKSCEENGKLNECMSCMILGECMETWICLVVGGPLWIYSIWVLVQEL